MTSTIKVDNIQDQDGNNIINENANTITIGASGDTVSLAAGASQTGFGRTGTVDWDTTPKTASFTAVSGDGFFCNTTSSAFTATLPAGSAGGIVSFADYAATWDTNNLTVTPDGTDKIGGVNASVVLNTEGQSVTFVYVDDTQGWVNVQDSTSNERAAAFITATGGTVTTCGDCKIHTFTSPGTFCVSTISSIPANNQVSYLVIAGGGGGGRKCAGGGGGAGGFREDKSPVTPYTASPLDGAGDISVTATAFPITVGGGGSAAPSNATDGSVGSNSVFSTKTSAGGGRGQGNPSTPGGGSGGSGGGGGNSGTPGGSGNTPPVSPAQGKNGGNGNGGGGSYQESGGGGGGATTVGANSASNAKGGNGGCGADTSISGSSVGRAGGGGGGAGGNHGFPVGEGFDGGGNGGNCQSDRNAGSGTANTGGGGGGGAGSNTAGSGGSGIVIIRYKFQ